MGYINSKVSSRNAWSRREKTKNEDLTPMVLEFAFDDQNLFPDATLFIVPNVDLYLVSILNSTVVEWFYSHVSPMIQQDFLRFKRIYLNQIPIPDASSAQRAVIEPLVCDLLDAKGQGPQVAEWEQELNVLVYEFYGLTNEEIKIIGSAK